MAEYQLTADGGIVRTVDGAAIPNDPNNRDRQVYDDWRGAGNAPDPYVAPPPTPEQVRVTTFQNDANRADMITRLRTATPAQIDSWVDANVTTLAQGREVFKKILKVLATDYRT